MQISILIQSIMVIVLFIAFPIVVVLNNLDHFGGLAWGYIALIAILVAVEAKMVWVKISIVKHAKKKAADLLLVNNRDSQEVQLIDDSITLPGHDTYEGEKPD